MMATVSADVEAARARAWARETRRGTERALDLRDAPEYLMTMIGFSFHEVMEGSLERAGERFDRPFRFSFDVRFPEARDLLTSAVGRAVGKVRIDGLARDVPAEGTLELAPIGKRQIRYAFTFRGDDGKNYRFEGTKTLSGFTRTRGWTDLPGELRAEDGALVGTARLRFSMRKHLTGLLGSFRLGSGRAS